MGGIDKPMETTQQKLFRRAEAGQPSRWTVRTLANLSLALKLQAEVPDAKHARLVAAAGAAASRAIDGRRLRR